MTTQSFKPPQGKDGRSRINPTKFPILEETQCEICGIPFATDGNIVIDRSEIFGSEPIEELPETCIKCGPDCALRKYEVSPKRKEL